MLAAAGVMLEHVLLRCTLLCRLSCPSIGTAKLSPAMWSVSLVQSNMTSRPVLFLPMAEQVACVVHGPPQAAAGCSSTLSAMAYSLRMIPLLCCLLRRTVQALDRVQPVLHVFGHIHEAYGTATLTTGTLAVNASTCDLSYSASQPPVVVKLSGCPGGTTTGRGGGLPLAGGPHRVSGAGRQRPKVVSVRKAWGC